MLGAGFKTVEQYYAAAGSHQRVHGVRVPLLVIQAEDDPIAPIAGTPFKALHDNPNCILAGMPCRPFAPHLCHTWPCSLCNTRFSACIRVPGLTIRCQHPYMHAPAAKKHDSVDVQAVVGKRHISVMEVCGISADG